jgi:hypothetical protein
MVGWVGIGGARLGCLGVLMPRGWLLGGIYLYYRMQALRTTGQGAYFSHKKDLGRGGRSGGDAREWSGKGGAQQLDAPAELQFPKNGAQMSLHGFVADAELRGDLFIRQPPLHPADDLLLPSRQGLPPHH